MKLNVKYDFNTMCKIVLQEQLAELSMPYRLHGLGEIEFERPLDPQQINKLSTSLSAYGIEIIDDQKSALVQRIKETITNMILHDDEAKNFKVSSYLSDKLNYSYVYLSNIFSEVTHSSIENFVILKKIDHAKSLIINKDYTLTEIAYQLNYSSVAHLSYQFKKTTGLTPSTFQKIIQKRRTNSIQKPNL